MTRYKTNGIQCLHQFRCLFWFVLSTMDFSYAKWTFTNGHAQNFVHKFSLMPKSSLNRD